MNTKMTGRPEGKSIERHQRAVVDTVTQEQGRERERGGEKRRCALKTNDAPKTAVYDPACFGNHG